MKVRRLTLVLTILVAPMLWALSSLPASAGGPTSVLMASPDAGRAAALYHTDAEYQRLVDLLQAYGPAVGETTEPVGVRSTAHESVRLTWLIHDMSIWRIDRVYSTKDGLWVQTTTDPNGGDPFAQPGRWHQPADQKALTAILAGARLLGGPVIDATDATDPEPAVAPRPMAAEVSAGSRVALVGGGAGLAGLLVGAGGALWWRRERAVRPPRVSLTG